ncbi:TetR/AcrR family transcriptional regulator [Aquihabitans daechungensis]|uniref:TetR/AcrR family transcriptional regulator n=1 Tax=Aquihabitans daechungensis TaxID=1052257 RepID=UPI003BA1E6EE
MAQRVKAHRASAQRRRVALLEAAAELAAEIGAGAVTHRAVAARAGVPLSTTSYFFSSIDELVTEALRMGATERVSDFDATERVAVLSVDVPIDAVIDAVVDQTLASSRNAQGSQLEYLLAAGRQPELQPEASAVVGRVVERVAGQLQRTGAVRSDEAAWAITALGDGAMLHRFAQVDGDARERLSSGLRLLIAAAMLRDEEIDELLSRFDLSVSVPGAVADTVNGLPRRRQRARRSRRAPRTRLRLTLPATAQIFPGTARISSGHRPDLPSWRIRVGERPRSSKLVHCGGTWRKSDAERPGSSNLWPMSSPMRAASA